MSRVYLDHAATTPLRAEVRDAWLAAQDVIGNASSIHGAGQDARRVLEDARERIATSIGCEPIEVVLTSGGTEAVSTALQGLWRTRAAGADRIVLPDGEHHATLDTVEWLTAHEEAETTPVALDRFGRIPCADFALAMEPGRALSEDGPGGAEAARAMSGERAASGSGRAALATALVAGNETGALNDAAGLAAAASEAEVPLHLDAIAAFGHTRVDFEAWRGTARTGTGLVALSVSGHKIGAPVGTGALVVSRTAAVEPLLHGGGQQRGLRAGTQDVAGAVALARAAELATSERVTERVRLGVLRERLVARLSRDVPEAVVLGHPERQLAGTVHLHLPRASGESLLFLLDQKGISVSTGSACQAGVAEPSHVVMALGYSQAEAAQVLRISMGRTTTEADIDALADALPEAYRRLTSR